MSKKDSLQPNRPLSVNFTNSTLGRAIKAKRRASRQIAIERIFKVNKRKFLVQPAGALIAIAIVIVGGVGAYAAANWFGGSVKVESDNSIMTIDLSRCESLLPPGIEQTSDRKSVKFKILGSPHIEAKELEQKLLSGCEWQTVFSQYQTQFGSSVAAHSGVVKGVDATSGRLTVSFAWAGQEFTKTYSLQQGARLYSRGVESTLSDFKVGDMIVFAYDVSNVQEGQNPFDKIENLKSVFKTQYDTRDSILVTKAFYTESNIMPLDMYNQIHQ